MKRPFSERLFCPPFHETVRCMSWNDPTSNKRLVAFRERRRAAGLVQVTAWLRPDQVATLRALEADAREPPSSTAAADPRAASALAWMATQRGMAETLYDDYAKRGEPRSSMEWQIAAWIDCTGQP